MEREKNRSREKEKREGIKKIRQCLSANAFERRPEFRESGPEN